MNDAQNKNLKLQMISSCQSQGGGGGGGGYSDIFTHT